MKERFITTGQGYAVALSWVYFSILFGWLVLYLLSGDRYSYLGLVDAWRSAGFGLGGTFPGSTVPASSRWKIGPWYVPQWMLRIDYIFISPHWEVRSARVAKFDGVSDHRGVIADLMLVE